SDYFGGMRPIAAWVVFHLRMTKAQDPKARPPCLPRHLLSVITREVMDQTSAQDYFAVHADHPQNRWHLPARMARQAPHESARTRKRGRDLGPASQFPRDRPLAGFARSAAAPVRAARHSIARTQCHFAGGRLCAGVRGKAACISRN